MRRTISFYWSNIDPRIPQAQREVMQALGLELCQLERTGMDHGVWMDSVVGAAGEDDTLLFIDIDCFPLSAHIVAAAFDAAENGRVFGIAQTANHLPDADILYAAPAFLGFTKRIWRRAGRPSFQANETHDVAGGFSFCARNAEVPVYVLLPYFVGLPKHRLGGLTCLGIATFFKGGVFHLMESRTGTKTEALVYVADCVKRGAEIDYMMVSKLAMDG